MCTYMVYLSLTCSLHTIIRKRTWHTPMSAAYTNSHTAQTHNSLESFSVWYSARKKAANNSNANVFLQQKQNRLRFLLLCLHRVWNRVGFWLCCSSVAFRCFAMIVHLIVNLCFFFTCLLAVPSHFRMCNSNATWTFMDGWWSSSLCMTDDACVHVSTHIFQQTHLRPALQSSAYQLRTERTTKEIVFFFFVQNEDKSTENMQCEQTETGVRRETNQSAIFKRETTMTTFLSQIYAQFCYC